MARRQIPVHAFGESKSQTEWLTDPRCVVDALTLQRRLRLGWDPERAITTELAPYEWRATPKGVLLWSAYGEEKSLYQWARDPRCQVSPTALKARVRKGMPLEDALTKAVPKYVAFGETKSVDEWVADPRCNVTPSLLRQRLSDGWDCESALSKPSRPTHYRKPLIEVFGEHKTLAEWVADPRCPYTLSGVITRLKSGLCAAEAIAGDRRSGPWRKRSSYWQTLYRAHGVEKPLLEWVSDARFEVVVATFMRRVAAGVAPEVAMRKRSRAR